MKPSQALEMHRAAIRRVVESHRAANARVFGSVLLGQDTDSSDLDLLVDPTPDTTLFDIGAMRHELGQLLGVPVDVLTPNALPDRFRARVLAQARPVLAAIRSDWPTIWRTSSKPSSASTVTRGTWSVTPSSAIRWCRMP